MKKIILIAAIIFLTLISLLLIFGRAFPSFISITNLSNDASYLKLDNDIFFRQTLNNCGPYSVMAVVNILADKRLDPENLSKEMTWRIYKNLTFPQGVINLLHKYDLKTKEFVLKNKKDTEKVIWLKSQIDQGQPVILLIKIHHILHYITVVGYNENGFMIYDSMQEKDINNPRKTIVDNGCLSGNRFYSYDELIKLWNDGGYKIFFKNWAVVCYK